MFIFQRSAHLKYLNISSQLEIVCKRARYLLYRLKHCYLISGINIYTYIIYHRYYENKFNIPLYLTKLYLNLLKKKLSFKISLKMLLYQIENHTSKFAVIKKIQNF